MRTWRKGNKNYLPLCYGAQERQKKSLRVLNNKKNCTRNSTADACEPCLHASGDASSHAYFKPRTHVNIVYMPPDINQVLPILTVSPIIQHVFAYHTISNINDSIRNMYSNVCDSSGIVHDTGARLTPPTIHELVVTEDTKLDIRLFRLVVTVGFRPWRRAISRWYFLHETIGVICASMLKMDGVFAPYNSGDNDGAQPVRITNSARIFPIADNVPHL